MQGAGITTEIMTTETWAAPANAGWLRVRSWWGWIANLKRSRPRHLRLSETLPLGDRRFVAVLEFDGARFLLGGTPSSLVLLARLENGDCTYTTQKNDLSQSSLSQSSASGNAKAAEVGRA